MKNNIFLLFLAQLLPIIPLFSLHTLGLRTTKNVPSVIEKPSTYFAPTALTPALQTPSLAKQSAMLTEALPSTSRFLKIMSKLHDDAKTETLKKLPTAELWGLYKPLETLEREFKNRQENPRPLRYENDVIQAAIFHNRQGSTILDAIQHIARSRLAKKWGCATDSMNDGTCPQLKEIKADWPKNWIRTLSAWEEEENDIQYDYDKYSQPKRVIKLSNIFLRNKNNIFSDTVNEITADFFHKERLEPNIQGRNFHIMYENPSDLLPYVYIMYLDDSLRLDMEGTEIILHLDKFPEAVRFNCGTIMYDKTKEQIGLDLAVALARKMGAHSIQIDPQYLHGGQLRRTLVTEKGFKEKGTSHIFELDLKE